MVNLAAYRRIRAEVTAAGAALVAVSKQRSMEDIQTLYDAGQRDFGENRTPELVEKQAALPQDIRWHFIGHLQRNKVRDLIGFVHLIHAVDSLRLLREIDKRAAAADRQVSVLLQFHVAAEANKHGLSAEGATVLLTELGRTPLISTRVAGVMGMATFTDDEAQVGREFDELVNHYTALREDHFAAHAHFDQLSMGMSGDYPLALARGSTLVRVGSALFT